MIQYARSNDSTATPVYFSQVLPALLTEPTQAHSSARVLDDVKRDPVLNRYADYGYLVWPGTKSESHAFHDFGTPDDAEGAAYLPPVITSFYGHQIVSPYGVTVTPLDTGRKLQLVVIDFHRADGDQTKQVSAVAWQGDNDTLHLTEPLPHEHEILGYYPRILFGQRRIRVEERHDWHLGKIYYGDSAILDIDISTVVTPGKALRA